MTQAKAVPLGQFVQIQMPYRSQAMPVMRTPRRGKEWFWAKRRVSKKVVPQMRIQWKRLPFDGRKHEERESRRKQVGAALYQQEQWRLVDEASGHHNAMTLTVQLTLERGEGLEN